MVRLLADLNLQPCGGFRIKEVLYGVRASAYLNLQSGGRLE